MSKRNTRLRVARIAAAAVIAGGASLTAVGAAQAVSPNHTSSSPAIRTLDQNTINGTDSGPSGTPSSPDSPPPSSPSSPPPSSPDSPPPSSPSSPPPSSPNSPPPSSPSSPPPSSPNSPPPTSSGTTNGTTSGNANGGPSSNPTSPSGTNPDGNNNTCTLTGESVDCGNNNTGTDNNTQQVPQGDTTSQLAETGSNGTTFLLIGAATLIAGGIGFRLSPRLASNRRDAA